MVFGLIIGIFVSAEVRRMAARSAGKSADPLKPLHGFDDLPDDYCEYM